MKTVKWIWVVVIILAAILLFFFFPHFSKKVPDPVDVVETPGPLGSLTNPAPTLELAYLYSQVKVGDRVFIGVIADTEGMLVDGVDVFIQIDNRLQVVNYIPTNALPVKPGTFVTKAGTTSTTVSFSQVANGGQPQAIKGLIAVIELKAITKGTAPLKFTFTLGATKDSNIAAQGKDVLTKVVNKTITVN